MKSGEQIKDRNGSSGAENTMMRTTMRIPGTTKSSGSITLQAWLLQKIGNIGFRRQWKHNSTVLVAQKMENIELCSFLFYFFVFVILFLSAVVFNCLPSKGSSEKFWNREYKGADVQSLNIAEVWSKT